MSVDARARRTAARASSEASEAMTRVKALEKAFRALSAVQNSPETLEERASRLRVDAGQDPAVV